MIRSSLVVAMTILGLAPMVSLSAALADGGPQYSKFGISENDIAAYWHLTIPSCATVHQENKDVMHPPTDVETVRHYVHLYAQCQATLEQEHAKIGVLRVNNVLLGLDCIALSTLDTSDDGVDPACNIKSYLPTP